MHKFMHNQTETEQVGGASADLEVGEASGDLEVVEQRHINAWKVMVHMVKPKLGRTDWSLFIDGVTEAYKTRVASFVRAENAAQVTMQVK